MLLQIHTPSDDVTLEKSLFHFLCLKCIRKCSASDRVSRDHYTRVVKITLRTDIEWIKFENTY